MATDKQLNLIMILQGRLGGPTRYVDLKFILGKNPIGHKMTKAEASRLIGLLQGRTEGGKR